MNFLNGVLEYKKRVCFWKRKFTYDFVKDHVTRIGITSTCGIVFRLDIFRLSHSFSATLLVWFLFLPYLKQIRATLTSFFHPSVSHDSINLTFHWEVRYLFTHTMDNVVRRIGFISHVVFQLLSHLHCKYDSVVSTPTNNCSIQLTRIVCLMSLS